MTVLHAFIFVLAGFVLSHPSWPRETNSRQPRAIEQGFCESQQTLSWTASNDRTYEIKISRSFGDNYPIKDYDPPYGGNISTTLGQVLHDLNETNGYSDWPKYMVLSTLEQALGLLEPQLFPCIDPSSEEDLAKLFGTSSRGPVSRAITPANKGAITASLIKGTAASIGATLGITSIYLSDRDAKLTTTAVALGYNVILLFLLSEAVTWVKNQGYLDDTDVAILKIFGDWSITTLRKTNAVLDSEASCPPTPDVTLAMSGPLRFDDSLSTDSSSTYTLSSLDSELSTGVSQVQQAEDLC